MKHVPIVFQSEKELYVHLASKARCVVYFNEDVTPFARKRDTSLKRAFQCVTNTQDYTLFDLGEGKVYKVFSPFAKSVQDKVPLPVTHPRVSELISRKLFAKPRYEALKILTTFSDSEAPSKIGVYLKYGLLSAREAYHGFISLYKKRELLFREFYYRVYWSEPRLLKGMVQRGQKNEAYDHKFDKAIPWNRSLQDFEKIVKAKTGNWAIDRIVTELTQTGYINNRQRMVLAMFFTKTLGLDWRWGEEWMASLLTDYDPVQNSAGWQWAASVGVSPSPYFRIMNPCNILERKEDIRSCIATSQIDLHKSNQKAKDKLRKAKDDIKFIFHERPGQQNDSYGL